MGAISTIVVVVIIVSFVFVAFFGRLPLLRYTPIATLNRIICVHFPQALLWVDQRLTSGFVSFRLHQFGYCMLYERHPTVVIFFLVLMFGAECLYLPSVWPNLNLFHKFLGSITIVAPYLTLYLAARGDPGFIDRQNLPYHLALYPYDYAIFHPGQVCRTCKFPKPARSKHCSLCKRCVARSDHHCIFINKCVGYKNHRWFILLLFSTAVLTSYGALLGISHFVSLIRGRFPAWSIWPGPRSNWAWYVGAWSWGLQRDVGLGSVLLLAIMILPMLWLFVAYTVYLLYRGMTTNESLKWSDWAAEMKDGAAFMRPLSQNHGGKLRVEAEAGRSRWPLAPEQIMITTHNGQAPLDNQQTPGIGPWERVWRTSAVENLYNLGLRANFLDVFVLDYQFFNQGGVPDEARSRYRRRKV